MGRVPSNRKKGEVHAARTCRPTAPGYHDKEQNEEIQQKLRDDPVELLISLLTEIKKELPIVSATLANTVKYAGFGVLESVKRRREAKKGRATK